MAAVPGDLVAMFGVAAIVAGLLALFMHLFGWSAGKLDVTTLYLVAFVCLSVHLVTGWWPTRGTPS